MVCPLYGWFFVCTHTGQVNGKYCCPKIYFNHRCFSGPYLNKGRIAELPQFIGPGNCVLVLKEVRIIGTQVAFIHHKAKTTVKISHIDQFCWAQMYRRRWKNQVTPIIILCTWTFSNFVLDAKTHQRNPEGTEDNKHSTSHRPHTLCDF